LGERKRGAGKEIDKTGGEGRGEEGEGKGREGEGRRGEGSDGVRPLP